MYIPEELQLLIHHHSLVVQQVPIIILALSGFDSAAFQRLGKTLKQYLLH